MRKYRVLGLALFAVFAFSAFLVASASAEVTLLAEWLKNGVAIATTTASKTTGEILWEDNKILGVKFDVLCSFIFDGFVGPNGAGEISEILNLAGEAVSELAGGKPLSCENKENCGSAGALVNYFPIGLPWKTLLFLKENGQIWDDVVSPGFDTECTILGSKITDSCTATNGLLQYQTINGGSGAELNGPSVPNGTCTSGGANSGVNEAFNDLITLNEGGALTVSSE